MPRECRGSPTPRSSTHRCRATCDGCARRLVSPSATCPQGLRNRSRGWPVARRRGGASMSPSGLNGASPAASIRRTHSTIWSETESDGFDAHCGCCRQPSTLRSSRLVNPQRPASIPISLLQGRIRWLFELQACECRLILSVDVPSDKNDWRARVDTHNLNHARDQTVVRVAFVQPR